MIMDILGHFCGLIPKTLKKYMERDEATPFRYNS